MCDVSFSTCIKRMPLRLRPKPFERIRHLYAIENEIRGRSPDERQQVRDNRSRPLLGSLQEWFKVSLEKLSQIGNSSGDQRSDMGGGLNLSPCFYAYRARITQTCSGPEVDWLLLGSRLAFDGTPA